MRCTFTDAEKPINGSRKVRCSRCGFVSPGRTPHPPDRIFRDCDVVGLGDIVAAGIELTGIGSLYRRLRGKKCGGCGQRQEALNEFGNSLFGKGE